MSPNLNCIKMVLALGGVLTSALVGHAHAAAHPFDFNARYSTLPIQEEADLMAEESRSSCRAKVFVKYADKGYRVMEVGHPSKVDSMRGANHRVGAFTRYRGISSSVKTEGLGCDKIINVTITWNEPIVVVMPSREYVGHCRYNRIFHHEFEHVKTFLDVPRDFEEDIINVAGRSGKPAQAVSQLLGKINKEAWRRVHEFHQFERSYSHGWCNR